MPRRRWSTQGPDPQGPQNATSGELYALQRRPLRLQGWQDAGVISARPRTMVRTIATTNAMPYSVLSTVFDHCTPTTRGKTATSMFPYSCIPSLLVSIKGGGGHPLKGSVDSLDIYRSEHTHLLLASDIVIRHAQTPLLAETSEPPSHSHLVCIPYYKHSGCKIIQCPRTPLCWMYGPVAGTRINPCVTVLLLASSSGTRKHAVFTSWVPGPRVRTPTIFLLLSA